MGIPLSIYYPNEYDALSTNNIFYNFLFPKTLILINN